MPNSIDVVRTNGATSTTTHYTGDGAKTGSETTVTNPDGSKVTTNTDGQDKKTGETVYNAATGETTTTKYDGNGGYYRITKDKEGHPISETTHTPKGDVVTVSFDPKTHEPTKKSIYDASTNSISNFKRSDNGLMWIQQGDPVVVPTP